MHDLKTKLESRERYLYRREKIFSIYDVNDYQRFCEGDVRDMEQILSSPQNKRSIFLIAYIWINQVFVFYSYISEC